VVRVLISAVVGAVVVGGCGAGAKKAASAWVDEAYAHVTLEDGVDAREAEVLAVAYFHSYISGCGAVGAIVDRGDAWEAETWVGIAARRDESIFIDKTTGVMRCRKGPMIQP
jgi:hypothetical protein